MRLTDTLIHTRERLLDTLLGIQHAEVLNGSVPTPVGADPTPVGVALKQAANSLKALAWEPSGKAVDYAALRRSDTYAHYRASVAPQLSALDLAVLSTREAALAFWINLYNMLVLDAVIAFGVQRSVTEGRLGILRFFRRAAYLVGGQRFSCDDIEHGILRANQGHPFIPGPHFSPSDPRTAFGLRSLDPRIHFALNCASRSCPPIAVYTPEAIDAQLDLATRAYLDSEVVLAEDRRTLCLPALFRWYAADFGQRAGVMRFLRHHLPNDERRARLEADPEGLPLAYTPYDWHLNTA